MNTTELPPSKVEPKDTLVLAMHQSSCRIAVANLQAHYREEGNPEALDSFTTVHYFVTECQLTPAEMGFSTLEDLLIQAYSQFGWHLASLKNMHALQVEELARIKDFSMPDYIAAWPDVAVPFLKSLKEVETATGQMIQFRDRWNAVYNNVLK